MASPAAPLRTAQLAIDPDSEPITGAVTSEDGARQAFKGWLELAAVLEELRTSRPADAANNAKRRGVPRCEAAAR